MRSKGTKTKYPGVFRVNDKTYRVVGEARDPRTGKVKQVERTLHGLTAQQAARMRADELENIRNGNRKDQEEKQPLRDLCTSWLKLKTPSVDWRTGETYAYALARVCGEPGAKLKAKDGGLGDFFEDAVRREDVQEWANAKLAFYSPETVRTWLRVYRAMAVDQGWADPTFRVSLPETPDRGANMLSEEQLVAFLAAMKAKYPRHFALTIVLAFTGLRFCHASALRFEDVDEGKRVLHMRRKQVRGKVGTISRKKRAPKMIPVEAEIIDVLRWHRQRMIEDEHPGLAEGWLFPSKVGKLILGTDNLSKAWKGSLKAAGIGERFTVHGLRRTFNDITRRAKVDPLVIKSITGHVTEDMREHYSTVDLEEKRMALASVVKRVQFFKEPMDGPMDEAIDDARTN